MATIFVEHLDDEHGNILLKPVFYDCLVSWNTVFVSAAKTAPYVSDSPIFIECNDVRLAIKKRNGITHGSILSNSEFRFGYVVDIVNSKTVILRLKFKDSQEPFIPISITQKIYALAPGKSVFDYYQKLHKSNIRHFSIAIPIKDFVIKQLIPHKFLKFLDYVVYYDSLSSLAFVLKTEEVIHLENVDIKKIRLNTFQQDPAYIHFLDELHNKLSPPARTTPPPPRRTAPQYPTTFTTFPSPSPTRVPSKPPSPPTPPPKKSSPTPPKSTNTKNKKTWWGKLFS